MGAGLDPNCFEGVLGRMAFAITDGLLALAVLAPIVTPASYVVWFLGKERDTGKGIMV